MPGVEGMELGIGQVVKVVPHVRFGKSASFAPVAMSAGGW
jgi:hypothetical protein